MQYDILFENILQVVNDLKYIHQEQLNRIFSDVATPKRVEHILTSLVGRGSIRWWNNDSETHILTTREYVRKTEKEVNELITALWVVTTKKSKEIRLIYTMRYPSQVGFVTETNELYDVTICNSVQTAELAVRTWNRSMREGTEDNTRHIALVPSREFCDEIKFYGFSYFCVLNDNYEPMFYSVR